MPHDPFIREKFTRERSAARRLVAEYYRHYPKDLYQTEVESWRDQQSDNIGVPASPRTRISHLRWC
jgi:hypothetical protein